jgi:hypothetical protein
MYHDAKRRDGSRGNGECADDAESPRRRRPHQRSILRRTHIQKKGPESQIKQKTKLVEKD